MVSGSRLADSVVKPTRSANRTVTTRRSVAVPLGGATTPSFAAGKTGPPPAGAPRLLPQAPQNLAPAGLVAPQAGQPPMAVPHSRQK